MFDIFKEFQLRIPSFVSTPLTNQLLAMNIIDFESIFEIEINFEALKWTSITFRLYFASEYSFHWNV